MIVPIKANKLKQINCNIQYEIVDIKIEIIQLGMSIPSTKVGAVRNL